MLGDSQANRKIYSHTEKLETIVFLIEDMRVTRASVVDVALREYIKSVGDWCELTKTGVRRSHSNHTRGYSSNGQSSRLSSERFASSSLVTPAI